MASISTSAFDQALYNSAQNPTQPIDPNVISGAITGTAPSALSSQAVSALFGFGSDIAGDQATAAADTAKATQDTLESQGYAIQQQGYAAEHDAYTQAQIISQNNANLALVSGQVQQAQNSRQVLQAGGAQRSAVAGSGFGNAGSSLFLYADTARQGAFGNQLIGTQAALNAAAYEQQAAASGSEIASTDAAAGQAAVAQQKALNAANTDTQAAATAAAAGVSAQTNLTNTISSLITTQNNDAAGITPTPTSGPGATAFPTQLSQYYQYMQQTGQRINI